MNKRQKKKTQQSQFLAAESQTGRSYCFKPEKLNALNDDIRDHREKMKIHTTKPGETRKMLQHQLVLGETGHAKTNK